MKTLTHLAKNRVWAQVLKRHRWSLILLAATFGVYFTILSSRLIFYKPEGLYAGHEHVWGDWALHINLANIFANKPPSEWFAYHPYFAGGKLTYGFLTNLISGLLMRIGWSIPQAFLIPTALYFWLLIYGLYALYHQALRTQKAALVSLSIFFLSSGLGFLRFLPVLLKNPSWQTLLYPPKDYSRLEASYQWLAGNWVTGMLMPQRAFLLGMTMGIWIAAIVIYVLNHPKLEVRKQHLLLALSGVLAGVLPIAHMHSFICLVMASASIALVYRKDWKKLLWYAVPAGLLGTAMYFKFISGGIQNPEFMKLQIGWSSAEGKNQIEHFWNWLVMWWEIWGVTLPLAAIGSVFFVKKLPPAGRAFLLAAWLIFAFGNIVQMQPVTWDNSKLFMWSYVGFSGLVTLVLQYLWRQHWQYRILAVICFICLTLTGVMELTRIIQVEKHHYVMSSTSDIALGKWVRENTGSQEVFLTNASHNHPVATWGVRPIVLGYTTWAWNFGFLIEDRLSDMHKMFEGQPGTPELFAKYHIKYVAIGSGELTDFHANEAFFKEHYSMIFKDQNYRIYQVAN